MSLKSRAALANLCLLKLKQLGGRATAREIAADLDKPPEKIQPRFSDLFNQGRIRDTGARVRGGRGRPQVIWADVDSTDAANDKFILDETPHIEEPSWFSKFGQ